MFDCTRCGRLNCGDGRVGDRGPASFVPTEIRDPDGRPVWRKTTCPLPALEGWEFAVIALHKHWRAGRYLDGGGLRAQNAWYLGAMEHCDALYAAMEAEEIEKIKQRRR